MKSRAKEPKVVDLDLPEGVLKSDLSYPHWPGKYEGMTKKDREARERWYEENLIVETLLFYDVDGRKDRGWCLTVLLISRSRDGRTDRYYGIETGTEEIVTIGNGPHVKRMITVYVTKARADELRRYLTLKHHGLIQASQIRDRISSRRAQGTLRRGTRGSFFGWMI